MPHITALTALLAPFAVYAQPAPPADFGAIGTTFGAVITFINGYIIPLFLAIAFFLFVWGMFNYFVRGGASDESRQKGKQLAIYAVAGFVLILSFWGLVNVIAAGFGFRAPNLQTMPAIPIPGRSGTGANPNCGAAC